MIQNGVTGFITKGLNVEDFTAAVSRIIDDPKLLVAMRVNARKAVEGRDWSEAFKKFWAMSPEVMPDFLEAVKNGAIFTTK